MGLPRGLPPLTDLCRRNGPRRSPSLHELLCGATAAAERSINAALVSPPVSLFGCLFVRQWNQCEPVPAVERLNVYNAIDPETGLQADCRKK